MASGFACLPALLLLSVAAGALGMLDPSKNSDEVVKEAVTKVCEVCRCTDDQVDCSGRKLATNLHDLEWPKTPMKLVNFENNEITEIRPFSNVSIYRLSFAHNKIEKIDSKAFKELINITELDLSHNLLTSDLMPDAFDGKFEPNAYEPLNLRLLDLSSNKLQRLHHDLFEHVVDLKRLILSDNPFHAFNGSDKVAVSGIAYLEELDLSHCQIKELDVTTLHSFKKLKKLDLSNNEFKKLPQALQDVKSLETLILDGNRFEFLGKDLDKDDVFPLLPNLKYLSMDNMATLLAIDKGAFSNLENLEVISIENCSQLEEISELAFVKEFQAGASTWPPLRTLNISDNALRYLPPTLLARWDRLEELHLMNNQWSCDCENQYLIGILLVEHGKRLMGDELASLRCKAPPEHLDKTLSSLAGRKLRCLDLYGARPERDAAVLVGLLVGVLLAMPVVLVFFLLWRRGFFFCGPQGPASFSRAFYRRAPPFNDDA